MGGLNNPSVKNIILCIGLRVLPGENKVYWLMDVKMPFARLPGRGCHARVLDEVAKCQFAVQGN